MTTKKNQRIDETLVELFYRAPQTRIILLNMKTDELHYMNHIGLLEDMVVNSQLPQSSEPGSVPRI